MWRVEATTARETRPVCHGGWRGWFERQQPAGRHCATASTELFFPQGSLPHAGMRSCRAPLQSSTRWPPSTLIVPYYFSAASRVTSNCGYSRRKSRQTTCLRDTKHSRPHEQPRLIHRHDVLELWTSVRRIGEQAMDCCAATYTCAFAASSAMVVGLCTLRLHSSTFGTDTKPHKPAGAACTRIHESSLWGTCRCAQQAHPSPVPRFHRPLWPT